MTACRIGLARAIAALADAVETLEETERPAVRLGEISQDLAEVERELAGLTETHQRAVANWIASGSSGERPQPSMRIPMLEARRALVASDAEAVEQIRPEAEEAHRRAAQRVRERQIERDGAIAAAAVDAAAHAFEQCLEAGDPLVRPVGEVQQGALLDLARLAIALAQQDGRG